MYINPAHEKLRSGIQFLISRFGKDSARQTFCSAEMCGPLVRSVSAPFLAVAKEILLFSGVFQSLTGINVQDILLTKITITA